MIDRTVVVTGASSGIGRAITHRLSLDGWTVVAVARRQDRLAELVAASPGVTAFPADVSDPAHIGRLAEHIRSEHGALHGLVNNAGIFRPGGLVDGDPSDWDEVLRTNLTGPYLVTRALAPLLVDHDSAIVNVSSVTGLRAFPGLLAYNVSKAGLDHMTRCIALELADRGIRVNAVNPGTVVTELHRSGGLDEAQYAALLESAGKAHPLGRLGRPEDVAGAVRFLLSEDAAWMTGDTVSVDGGRHATCLR